MATLVESRVELGLLAEQRGVVALGDSSIDCHCSLPVRSQSWLGPLDQEKAQPSVARWNANGTGVCLELAEGRVEGQDS